MLDMEWISVKDRLPNHLTEVICYSRKHGIHTALYNGAGDLNEFLSRGYEIPNVDYWIELSNIPKPPVV